MEWSGSWTRPPSGLARQPNDPRLAPAVAILPPMNAINALATRLVAGVLGLATLYVVLDNAPNVRIIFRSGGATLGALYDSITGQN